MFRACFPARPRFSADRRGCRARKSAAEQAVDRWVRRGSGVMSVTAALNPLGGFRESRSRLASFPRRLAEALPLHGLARSVTPIQRHENLVFLAQS